jgi:hypothetical protein
MIRARHIGRTKISRQTEKRRHSEQTEKSCHSERTEKSCHSERAKRVEESRRGRCCLAGRTARPLDFARGDSKKGIAGNGWRTRHVAAVLAAMAFVGSAAGLGVTLLSAQPAWGKVSFFDVEAKPREETPPSEPPVTPPPAADA